MCDKSFTFDALSVQVVCRQLGYLTAGSSISLNFDMGGGPIWLNNLRCLGDETGLIDCPFSPIEDSSCTHFRDIGVRCEGKDINIELTPQLTDCPIIVL